jgi:hypothetical protein
MSGGQHPTTTTHAPHHDQTPRQKPFRAPREGFCHFKGLSCVSTPWR